MNISRRTITAAALAVAALGTTAVIAGPAAAAPRTTAVAAADATAQAAYNGVCGTGYTVIDSTPVPDKGTVYVTYSKATGKNCAVSIRTNPGTPVWMAVTLNIDAGRGAPSVTDSGSYSTYAGPVYLDAKGQCIQWTTAIDGVLANGHGHCG